MSERKQKEEARAGRVRKPKWFNWKEFYEAKNNRTLYVPHHYTTINEALVMLNQKHTNTIILTLRIVMTIG